MSRRKAKKKDLPRWLTFTGMTGRAVMWVCAILLGLTYFSVCVNPAKFWPIALFGLLFFPVALVNLFFLVWAVKRRSRTFLIPLFALLPALFFLGEYFRFPSSARPLEAAEGGEVPTVRIITYNVGRFLQGKEDVVRSRTECMDSVLSFIRRQDADIVCLQEFYLRDISRARVILMGLMNGYYPEYYLFPGQRGHYGNVTFSRYKAVDKGVIKFDNSTNLAIYSDYRTEDGGTFRVYNCHFESYNISFTGLVRSLAQRDSAAVRNVEDKMIRGITRRPNQVNRVLDHIASSPVEAVVCGDFNDTPMSYTYFRMNRQRQDTFCKAGEGFGSTFSVLWPLIRIDYILCPKGFRPLEHLTPRLPYSDHYPVVSTMEVLTKSV